MLADEAFKGGGERGVLVPDIEIGNALQMLPTGSSVLTITLDKVSVLLPPVARAKLTYSECCGSIWCTRDCEMGILPVSTRACQ